MFKSILKIIQQTFNDNFSHILGPWMLKLEGCGVTL